MPKAECCPEMLAGATPTQYREREGLVALLNSGLIPHWHMAIDGGAHVGTWSELLKDRFDQVHAFEPGPAYKYLVENARKWPNVVCRDYALADEKCTVESWHRKPGAKMTARKIRKVPDSILQGVPLDGFMFPRCSLIKLDVEGYEYPALIGALETIARCKPFVLVELAGHGGHVGKTDADVVALLGSMGYHEVWNWGVDHGFLPKGD